MILTQSQVSAVFSAGIVFVFTVVLFLSGYVLQQRTVHSLQAAIRPRLPKPLPAPKPIQPPTLDVKWARPIGAHPEGDEKLQHFMAEQALDWSRLGYVQVVREPLELCSAVMLLADLHKMRSPAKRILLFPRAWLRQMEDETAVDMYTTRRLLKTAVRMHGVTLMPMETIVDGADESLASSYSLASLYSLTTYERLVYLQQPGSLVDPSALDSLLAFSRSEPMAAYPATAEREDMSTSLLIVHPSDKDFRRLKEARTSQAMTDLELFRKAFTTPNSLISEWSLSMGNVVYDSHQLRDAIDGFNATVFEAATTFVRFSDPEIPGPEYDLPFYERMALRPKNEEAREAWGKLYDRFRQRRMEVCGLDLETYSRPGQADEEDEGTEV
ncbi:hypothetical protein EJ04DRAFT_511199 [Polyplosphaeria fusca]|uniref:Glycosyltransferase family 8 protein n=1 Tax=Polyplosphaeria fusca TaxID=682080 RepID=A0A9P4V4A8_9PLEO|nr:hypothetical protein EJ04DRAFT_511199 [Polyplosphaeria fusca]